MKTGVEYIGVELTSLILAWALTVNLTISVRHGFLVLTISLTKRHTTFSSLPLTGKSRLRRQPHVNNR